MMRVGVMMMTVMMRVSAVAAAVMPMVAMPAVANLGQRVTHRMCQRRSYAERRRGHRCGCTDKRRGT